MATCQFFPFCWAGVGRGVIEVWGALSSPQKPKNSRWPDMHSDQSVDGFVTSWQVGFTANFAMKTSLFSSSFFFFWGGGRGAGKCETITNSASAEARVEALDELGNLLLL